jgi:hypothetical protein
LKRFLPVLLAACVCPLAAAVQNGEQGAGGTAQVEFRFENPKLQPARYTLTIDESGAGRFHAEGGPPNPDDPAALPPQGQSRPVQISAAVTHRIFAIARQKHYFQTDCDSGDDKVAFQGQKTLTYNGPAGHGSCTYNYTKDAQIDWVTHELEGVASTLEEGRRLDLLYQHSRLGLDAELGTLTEMAQNGDATELANIAPILHDIATNTDVLQRAQRRAAALLVLAEQKGSR